MAMLTFHPSQFQTHVPSDNQMWQWKIMKNPTIIRWLSQMFTRTPPLSSGVSQPRLTTRSVVLQFSKAQKPGASAAPGRGHEDMDWAVLLPPNKQGMWKNEDWNFETTFSGWWLTCPSEKYQSIGKDDIPYIMENKKCLKPPTSFIIETMWKNEFQDGKYKSLWGLKLHWISSKCGRMKFELTNTKNQRRDFVEGNNVENAWEGWETLDLCGMGNAYSEQTHYPGKLNHRHKNVFAKSNPQIKRSNYLAFYLPTKFPVVFEMQHNKLGYTMIYI
jgi:hypothetical protein